LKNYGIESQFIAKLEQMHLRIHLPLGIFYESIIFNWGVLLQYKIDLLLGIDQASGNGIGTKPGAIV